MRNRLAFPAALSAALLLPASAVAQQVEGHLLDADEGTPVVGATISLEDSTGQVLRQVVSNNLGGFRIWWSDPGTYRLRAERIGYGTIESQVIQVDSGQVVEVELRMRPEAVVLEPLTVVARRRIRRGTPDEFYDRMDRLADRGEFVTREEIERYSARLPSRAVALAPNTWVQPIGLFQNRISLMSYGKRCQPTILLNGLPLPTGVTLDEMADIDWIEGIEIYRGHFVPDTYAIDDSAWGCGIILVWTRTDSDPRWAFSWKRTITAGLLGGLLFGLTALF